MKCGSGVPGGGAGVRFEIRGIFVVVPSWYCGKAAPALIALVDCLQYWRLVDVCTPRSMLHLLNFARIDGCDFVVGGMCILCILKFK